MWLGNQNQIDDFPNRSFPTILSAHIMDGFADSRNGIGRSRRKPDRPQHFQIVDIVTDVRHLAQIKSMSLDNVTQYRKLIVSPLVHFRDGEFLGPSSDQFRLLLGNQRRKDARPLQ